MGRYNYKPLTVANSTRIISLLPGFGCEQLECKLNHFTLDECPDYEAISYVWGDETNPASIICDGLGQSLSITQNLAVALFRFRQVDKPRLLWIDAICINQEDITERGQQVRLMGRIYRAARCVLIWLGEEDEHTELVSACFRSSFIELIDKEIISLERFFRRPWFHRAWTYQESILARQARFHCGSYHFPKQTIYDAIQGLSWATDSGLMEPEFEHLLKIASNITRPINSPTIDFSFRELVLSRRGSQCKDPRDLIYSLLGIASDAIGIEPDYSKSIQDVFTSAARNIITSTRDLSILRQVNTQKFDETLPSWVPDWRERRLESVLSLRLDDWAERHNDRLVDAGLAQLAPFRPRTVNHATHLYVYGLYVDEIKDQVDGEEQEAFFNLFRHEKYYCYGSDRTELALLRTIALDYSFHPEARGTHKPPAKWKLFLKAEDFYDTSFRNKYADLFMRTTKGQKLFRTTDGLMGLGPHRSQKGDIVCIICGIESPVLLRPAGNEYLFVGHCYVYELFGGTGLYWARSKARRKQNPDDDDVSWIYDLPIPSEMQELILK